VPVNAAVFPEPEEFRAEDAEELLAAALAASRSPAEALRRLRASHGELAAEWDRLEALYVAEPKLLDEGIAPYAPYDTVGRRIGDFRLVVRLGIGAQGSVWRATQVSVGRDVALKLLHPHLVDSVAINRLRQEALAAGRLEHPNLVAVYAAGQDEGVHWIAQELVDGSGTLEDHIEHARRVGHVGVHVDQESARIVCAVLRALSAAHAAGVVHRDVKPANILLSRTGAPKLTDFGLARLDAGLMHSRSGEVVGTYLYMSPEQLRGDRQAVGPRTDVYSAGVVLFELLTHRRPLDGRTFSEVAEKIRCEIAPNAQTLRARVPRDLAVICSKALDKDPERRYATADAFADDLERFLRSESILAHPPTRRRRAALWIRRHPARTTGYAALAALVLVVAMATRLIDKRATELDAAEQRLRAFAARLTELGSMVTGEVRWARYPGNGLWYGWTPRSESWRVARELALRMGGDLATLDDAAHRDWILKTLIPGVRIREGVPDDKRLAAWIGMNDMEVEGNWVWCGRNSSYREWNPGEPNDRDGEDAALFNWNNNGGWNDGDSGSPHFALVELASEDMNGDGLPDVWASLLDLNVAIRQDGIPPKAVADE
jgi:hypothetical protein